MKMSERTFGRYGARRETSPAASPPIAQIALPDEPGKGFFQICYAGGIPVVTCGLIPLLSAIFLLQVELAGTTSPGSQALIQFGAVSGNLVIEQHQWWRVLTAAMLHGSPSHLIGNCIALFFAGFYLEPMIGAGWLIAIFFSAAASGFALSLTQHTGNVIAIGASGGIMGLVAMLFLCSFRMYDGNRSGRVQWVMARMMMTSVLPVFLPDVASHSGIDYAGHAGGALAGIGAWLLLNNFWDDDSDAVPIPKIGAIVGSTAGLLAILAFVATAVIYRPVVKAPTSMLIPQSEIPADAHLGAQHSADLVAHFPGDPRAHYLRGLYFLDKDDLSSAADELRQAIAHLAEQPHMFRPSFGATLNLTLALILRQEGDLQEARIAAKGACDKTDDYALSYEALREGLCS